MEGPSMLLQASLRNSDLHMLLMKPELSQPPPAAEATKSNWEFRSLALIGLLLLSPLM
jgi:hypothetical protein